MSHYHQISVGIVDRIHRQDFKSLAVKRSNLQSLSELLKKAEWAPLVATELQSAFADLLSSVSPDPEGFRRMMKDTGAVISGSMALHFVLRRPKSWNPGDMDLIAPKSRFAEVLDYVKTLPGASVTMDITSKDNARYPMQEVGFRRVVKVSTAQGAIDVIQSKTESALYPIPFYWGTHVMNALTWEACICAYPSLTLNHLAYVTARRDHPSTALAMAKYVARGFTVLFEGRREQEVLRTAGYTTCGNTCGNVTRYFGDGDCLTVAIADGKLVWVRLRLEAMTVGWRLGGKGCGSRKCFVESGFMVGTMRLKERGHVTFETAGNDA